MFGETSNFYNKTVFFVCLLHIFIATSKLRSWGLHNQIFLLQPKTIKGESMVWSLSWGKNKAIASSVALTKGKRSKRQELKNWLN